jgi:SAM-dependent methyltransferase
MKDVFDFVNKDKIKVLDWGCGNGWFSYFLIYAGFRNVISYGYGWDDIGPAMKVIPELQVVNGAECNLQSPSQLPFKDGEFDVIFSIGVLEHVHETGGEQTDSMKEIYRTLKPGGIFYCYHFPNKGTWIEYFKSKLSSNKDYLHTRKFNRKDIEELAGGSGFEILKVKRYNLLPYNIFRKNRLDNKLFATTYKLADRMLSLTPLNHFAQAYMFVARKK